MPNNKLSRLLIFLALYALLATKAYAQTTPWLQVGPNVQHISAIEITPEGFFAGEHDTRGWLFPYNGVYFNRDLTGEWQEVGLQGRRINDLHYNEGRLFAATKQVIDSKLGLFSSLDGGETWQHYPQINFGINSVAAAGETIVAGGTNHGLWVSKDSGETWEQKIGDGYLGPKVHEIFIDEDLCLVAADLVYLSFDKCDSFYIVDDLSGLEVNSFAKFENVLFAASESVGVLISHNNGSNWDPLDAWGDLSATSITQKNGVLFALSQGLAGEIVVNRSADAGNTWENLNEVHPAGSLNNSELKWYFLEGPRLIINISGAGIFTGEIPELVSNVTPFLHAPWEINSTIDVLDSITSIFDHEYPLLGYNYHQENEQVNKTTLSYLGVRLPENEQFYSSHDGYDFGVPYGTPVLATAEGLATYYYCEACGHTIKIDHLNGYQTTYMHLQLDGLITTNDIPTNVKAGDVIGKVGMTGRTTGPHIHFSVLQDKNGDGVFVNDSPYGKTDPFGWQSVDLEDPWEKYVWSDLFGTHTGSKSHYLWTFPVIYNSASITSLENFLELENKSLSWAVNTASKAGTLVATAASRPLVKTGISALKYVENTSLDISVYDLLSDGDYMPPQELTLEYDLSDSSFVNFIRESIKIYYFDEETNLWEELETVLDEFGSRVSAKITHLSKFAVFGVPVDASPPIVSVEITGQKTGDWFVEYPTIDVTTEENATVYYKYFDEVEWHTYTTPFLYEKEGIGGVSIKAADENENWTNTTDELIKVDTDNLLKGQVKVLGVELKISE